MPISDIQGTSQSLSIIKMVESLFDTAESRPAD